MRAAAVAADAERQHVRMLDEEQEIANAAGLAILDERALHRERLSVSNNSQSAYFNRFHLQGPTDVSDRRTLRSAATAAQDPNSPAAVSPST